LVRPVLSKQAGPIFHFELALKGHASTPSPA
jgi:hypothetical protein